MTWQRTYRRKRITGMGGSVTSDGGTILMIVLIGTFKVGGYALCYDPPAGDTYFKIRAEDYGMAVVDFRPDNGYAVPDGQGFYIDLTFVDSALVLYEPGDS